MNNILELSEQDKIIGQIYKMTNIITKKCYIGQTRSHKLNKNKFRPSGYIRRFDDHISEAINNTKKNQCIYLNNAIRKYGKDKFIVELIETCSLKKLNERETYNIINQNTIFPNGYNLIKGQEFSKGLIKNNEELQNVKKRGREFGYKHKEETLNKMKKYYDTIDNKTIEKIKNTMSNTISNYFADKRAETLANSNIILDENFKDLIRPLMKDNKIVSYIIRYKRKKYTNITGQKYTLEEKYNILYNALKKAYDIQQNKLKSEVKITEISERIIDYPQPST